MKKSIQISIHSIEKHTKFHNTIVKYMEKYINFNTITQEKYKCLPKYIKKYTNFFTSTQETCKFSKNYSKIHENTYKKVKIFHSMTHKIKNLIKNIIQILK